MGRVFSSFLRVRGEFAFFVVGFFRVSYSGLLGFSVRARRGFFFYG